LVKKSFEKLFWAQFVQIIFQNFFYQNRVKLEIRYFWTSSFWYQKSHVVGSELWIHTFYRELMRKIPAGEFLPILKW